MKRINIEEFNIQKCTDKDVINSWKWMKSYISETDWHKRKVEIEKKILMEVRTSEHFSDSIANGTLLVVKDDIIGWYLYLLDMFINEPYKYEYFQGARIVPVFKRFGEDLDILRNIKGVDIRLKNLFRKRRSEADAVFFELLTALLWSKNGYEVEFIPENSEKKTPDFIAMRDGKTWNVECKRQGKTSMYAYEETKKRQTMISYISKTLIENNVLLDIVFHVELKSLPDTYLRDLLKNKLNFALPGKIISNNEVDIDLTFVDITAMKKYLKSNFVKDGSPMLCELIGKKPIDNKGFTCGTCAEVYRVGEGEVNNLYISDVANAFGVYCFCDAEESIWAKARDIKSQLYKAMQQLNSSESAIVHFGMETFDGPDVENIRFEKIKSTIEKIDVETTNLKWIFCHFFQSYSTHDQVWVFDETVTSISRHSPKKSPLKMRLMVTPNNANGDIFHWDKPLP